MYKCSQPLAQPQPQTQPQLSKKLKNYILKIIFEFNPIYPSFNNNVLISIIKHLIFEILKVNWGN